MLIAFSVAPSGTPAEGTERTDASVHDAVAAAVRVGARVRSAAPHDEHVHRDRGAGLGLGDGTS